MAEKTLEERLSELYEKIDHRDQFFDKDLKTLIDGIRDAREHGGTSDYTDLSNKPAINGVQLSGDKTPAQLGLATANQVETLSNKVDKLPTGYYYGKFDSVEDLPEATEKGYAYVASSDPTVFYTYLVSGAGAEWVDSGNKMVNTVDITTPKTTETELSKNEKYYASANVNDRPADVVIETGIVMALGYKVLSPNLGFAEQVTEANTIYEIKDSFDLNGGSVTILANCTLYFNGGKLGNGTILGTNTSIKAGNEQIFEQGVFKYKGYSTEETTTFTSPARVSKIKGSHIVIGGSWIIEAPNYCWLGLDTISSNVDAAPSIMNFIRLHTSNNVVNLPKRTYGVFSSIDLLNVHLNANDSIFNVLAVSSVYDETIPIPDEGYKLSATMFPQGIAPLNYMVRVRNGKLSNLTIDGNNQKYGETYVHTTNGIYGLLGALDVGAEIVNCTVLNSYQCGILSISNGNILIKGCLFKNMIEHCIYGRPSIGGTTNIEDCIFDTWYMQDTHRGTAKAIKLIQSDDIDTSNDLTVNINNCTFKYNGTATSTLYMGWIGAGKTNFTNCVLNGNQFIFCYTHATTKYKTGDYATKVNYVKFENCIGSHNLQTNTTNYGAIIDYYNCTNLTTDVLQWARNVEDCYLLIRYNATGTTNYRGVINITDFSENRILNLKNCYLTKGTVTESTATSITILGAYKITIDRSVLDDYNSLGAVGTHFEFKTNSNNTSVEDETTLTIRDSNFCFRYMAIVPIFAEKYAIKVYNSIFSANIKTGYATHYVIFGSFDTLYLENVSSKPYGTTGKVVNIFRTTDLTKVTYPKFSNIASGQTVNGYVSSVYGTYYPAKGTKFYDTEKNIEAIWNGTAWVEYDNEPYGIRRSGTSSQRPANCNIGFKYFDTTLGKPIFWNGVSWIDANGDYIFDNSGSLQNRLAITAPVKGQQFKLTREGETDVYFIYGDYGWLNATDRSPWFDDSGSLNAMYDKYNYTLLTAQPSDWDTKYNTYYKIVDNVYTLLTTLETWAEDTYYKKDVNVNKGIQVKLTDTDTELSNKVVKWNGTKYINIVDNKALKAGIPEITFTTENNITTATITSTSSGKIYYTKDGNDPTSLSTEYSSAITLADGDQVKAICIRDHMDNSNIGFVPVSVPVITFSSAGILTITCETPNAKIYYTIDGSTPTTSSTEYDSSASVTIAKGVTVKAFAVLIGLVNSTVASKKRS